MAPWGPPGTIYHSAGATTLGPLHMVRDRPQTQEPPEANPIWDLDISLPSQLTIVIESATL